jgi:isopenicillin-N epimerase
LSVAAIPISRAASWRSLWLLDPEVIYLNHGSFGACPIPVLEYQQQLRQAMEKQPMEFLGRRFEAHLDQARQRLGDFLGAESGDLAFVPNATTGVNTVLRSLSFQPGDQILTTNHGYNACRNALEFMAARSGVEVVVAEIPFPLESPEQITTAILNRVTPQTRLALLDHVSSQTGLIFPLPALVPQLGSLGIQTLIDGAHAAGMLPLNLAELGATYYAGNCHKWLCAPKGAGFLYVQPEFQSQIHPLTISHGFNADRCDRPRFWLEFDWTGTHDPTAYLSVPAAMDCIQSLIPGGWPAVMTHNRQTLLVARQLICDRLGMPLPCPDEMIGTLGSIPLADAAHSTLQEVLLKKFKIEVPVFPWPAPPKQVIRISANLYNTLADYEQLADALHQLHEQIMH